MYDSAGVVYLMPRFRIPLRGTWVRILDTEKLERKQGKDESYWPVGLSEDSFMCLILKGRQEHPTFPRPLIQDLPVRLPFRGKDPKDAPLEEQWVYFRPHVLKSSLHRYTALHANLCISESPVMPLVMRIPRMNF